MKRYNFFIFFIVLSFSLQAQDENNELQKSINELQEAIKVEQNIRESDYRKINEQFDSRTFELENSINEIEKELAQLDEAYLINLSQSRIGAIILLFGLLIEIIGAILLASNYFVDKIDKIRSVKIETGLFDLSMENQVQKSVINYLSGLGSVFLVLGFLFQFVGTIIVALSSTLQITIYILIGILIPIFVILFLTGQNPKQSRKEKIVIMFYNIRITFINPILLFLLPGSISYCEICGRLIRKKQGEIWYVQEDETNENNSLHKPHSIRFGHIKCLSVASLYGSDLKTNSWMDSINTHKVYRAC